MNLSLYPIHVRSFQLDSDDWVEPVDHMVAHGVSSAWSLGCCSNNFRFHKLFFFAFFSSTKSNIFLRGLFYFSNDGILDNITMAKKKKKQLKKHLSRIEEPVESGCVKSSTTESISDIHMEVHRRSPSAFLLILMVHLILFCKSLRYILIL